MSTHVSDSLAADKTIAASKPVAVIDIGATSIRMAIGEIDANGRVRTLETLTQAVSLGKDTFTQGSIHKSTIEDCVRVLKSYRRILKEYQIERPEQIRVVATSAVREASNRLAFIDRVYIATGIDVEPIDEAEVNRVTYLGIQPYLQSNTASQVVVAEVGGGSTELLLVKDGNVAFAHTYRLGSLRLRQQLEAYHAPVFKVRNIMESQIKRTVEQIREDMAVEGAIELIALGGDVRFAAAQLLADWNPTQLARIPLGAMEKFSDKMLNLSDDEIVQKYHLSFPDAETVGPALLTYVHLARAFGLESVSVTNTNLRDGLLKEMAAQQSWTDEFRHQIVRSALALGRKFEFDEGHSIHVAELCRSLFAKLQDEHRLDPRHEIILYVAALLYEIGLFVSNRSYHKHSMYLIRNSELFGLGKTNLLLVALVARYHRRASPLPTHEGYATLDRDHRVAVAKMAAILRIAVALDESRSQRVQELDCSREGDRMVLTIPHVEDLSLEQLALRQNGSLFEEIFGMQILLRTTRY